MKRGPTFRHNDIRGYTDIFYSVHLPDIATECQFSVECLDEGFDRLLEGAGGGETVSELACTDTVDRV